MDKRLYKLSKQLEPSYLDGSSRSNARSSKRVMLLRNVKGTAPTGPLRCLAMTSSALPSSSFLSSSSSR